MLKDVDWLRSGRKLHLGPDKKRRLLAQDRLAHRLPSTSVRLRLTCVRSDGAPCIGGFCGQLHLLRRHQTGMVCAATLAVRSYVTSGPMLCHDLA